MEHVQPTTDKDTGCVARRSPKDMAQLHTLLLLCTRDEPRQIVNRSEERIRSVARYRAEVRPAHRRNVQEVAGHTIPTSTSVVGAGAVAARGRCDALDGHTRGRHFEAPHRWNEWESGRAGGGRAVRGTVDLGETILYRPLWVARGRHMPSPMWK